MRLLKFNSIAILLLLIGLSFQAKAEFKQEFKRTINKEFKLSKDGKVDLANKYGTITVQTAAHSDQVVVNIEIVVKAGSESKAEKVFDRIDVLFNDSKDLVSVKTEIAESSGWNTSSDFQIHYYITMPVENRLVLTQKFGNVSVDDIANDVDVSVKYGNLSMNDVNGKTKISLGYGKGEVGCVGDLDLNIQYSEIEFETAENANLYSKYSKLSFDVLHNVNSESKYDKLEIKKVESFENNGKYDYIILGEVSMVGIETKYTTLKIDQLQKQLHLDQKYGDVKINTVGDAFKEILIDARYLDVKLGFNDNASFNLDFEGDYAGCNIPNGLDLSKDIHDDSERIVVGTAGNNSGGEINVRMDYGGLKIHY